MTASQFQSVNQRVIIIGAGLMGLWPALLLAERGCAVTVLEAGAMARGASWAAAGMLAPGSEAGEAEQGPPLLDEFGVHSLGMWADWAARFTGAGHQISWRPKGGLLVAFDETSMAQLNKTENAARQLGLASEVLDPAQARLCEPGLDTRILGALKIADEASVDPRCVLLALQDLLDQAGGKIHYNFSVQGIETKGEALRVACANGAVFDADQLVIAAGFAAGNIDGISELNNAIQPVKGQMLSLSAASVPLGAVMRNHQTYIVPRNDGTVIIGATSEPGLSDTKTQAEVITAQHQKAAHIVPALAQAQCTDRWAGIRPHSVDGLPIIGPMRHSGLFAHCGHHRNGVLLAPASAQLLCDMMLGQDGGRFAGAFLPERFLSC